MPSHRHTDSAWRLYDAGGWANRYGAQAGTYNTPIANGVTYTEYTGGGQAHNNLQPYSTVYYWLRVA